MIKLSLQPTNSKDAERLQWNIGGMLVKDSDNLPEEWEKFTYLACKLLFALVSDSSKNVELLADHLAVCCETEDDLYALREAVLDLAATLGKRWDAIMDGINDQ